MPGRINDSQANVIWLLGQFFFPEISCPANAALGPIAERTILHARCVYLLVCFCVCLCVCTMRARASYELQSIVTGT
jgi:hypothetical protein